MNRTRVLQIAGACILAMALSAASEADSANSTKGRSGYTLSRQTVDGGGTTKAIGAGYQLSATVAQPDAGQMSGAGYELTGGFWFQQPPGDCNADSIIDLLDHADFVPCLGGPGTSWANPICRCFDFDQDDDIDLKDFARFAGFFAS